MAAPEHQIDQLVADAFRRASWRVHRPRAGGAPQPDLIVEGGGSKFVVEIKRSSEGRRDRVIPLLSQAILEAEAFARRFPEAVVPAAVVGAPHLPPAVVDAVQKYADRVAPQMVVGLVDAEGLRAFWGHGLEVLNARPSSKEHRARQRIAGQRLPHLFSDLNQWMLKVLLAESVPVDLLSAPRQRFRNPTELARAADVSVMSAFRLVRQLANENCIAQGGERLGLVRIPGLLSRWSAWREPVQEFPVRWLVKRDQAAVAALLRSYSAGGASVGDSAGEHRRQPRVYLGLFAAANALGFGFVHGVPPHIYMERFDPGVLQRFGLSVEGAEHSPDAFVRIPANPQAVFRAAVMKDGVPCGDILQVWLDVSDHPSRGKGQADEIARRALGTLLKGNKRWRSHPTLRAGRQPSGTLSPQTALRKSSGAMTCRRRPSILWETRTAVSMQSS